MWSIKDNPICEDEYLSLESIYSKELRRVENDIILTLFPLHNDQQESYCQIDLHVIPTKLYPQEEPVIRLTDSKGLSNQQIQTLQSELEQLAAKKKGAEVIYELALHVQEFLSENNKPGIKSFYDEMMNRKTQQEQQKNEIEEDKKMKKCQDVLERYLRRAALITDEDVSSDEGEDSKAMNNIFDKDSGIHSNCNGSHFDENVCEHNSCKYINFTSKVLRGSCIDHDKFSILYRALDNTTGKFVTIREWILKVKEKQPEIFDNTLKQIDRLQQELNYLKKFEHSNIVPYLDLKKTIEKNECIVYILQDYVSNINLNVFMNKHMKLEINVIRYFVIGILNALMFLHDHSITHRNLNGSNVYLSNSGSIKIGDHSLKKRMDDIYQAYHNNLLSDTKDKAGPKTDIHQLGCLLLSLMGISFNQEEVVVVPDSLPPDLKDFIEKCLIENEQKRWSAKQLIEHKFVKNPLPRHVKMRRSITDIKRNSESLTDEESEEANIPLLDSMPSDLKRQSRLLNDFEVLKEIGSGTFGKVLKARNNLDGNIYAIKVINLNPRSKQLNKKIIREVQLLSKLNHENVVRYYNSWIETRDKDESSKITNVTTTPLQTLAGRQTYGGSNLGTIKSVNSRKSQLDDNEDDEDEEDDEDDDDDEDEDDYEDEDDEDEENFVNDKAPPESSGSIVFKKESAKGSENGDSEESDVIDICKEKTMYIQMEFCEKNTLRKAIDKDSLFDDQPRSWRLFREIVEGLSYIHEQDMIHRDLKPVNIFLDIYDHVKIGDFGLATSVIHKDITGVITGFGDQEPTIHALYEGSHTGGVGTSIYIAPELTKPFGKLHYNQKVDIYSLGIIFFEMCHSPFATHMEKCKIISDLRLPEVLIPCMLEKKMPKQMELVKMLLNHDPKLRPSCQEILEGDFLPPPLIEDEEVQEFVKNTLSNPQSKAYKYLVSSIFEQKTALEDDVSYHLENVRSEKLHILQEIAKEKIEKILKKHGAVYLPTPLLLPKSDIYANVEACVKLMTHSGSIVNLPYDLRVPFARYVASKEVTRLRRYAVDRVYREKKIHGFHPKELYECVFDIVTPTQGDLVSDSEMLTVLNEIVNQLPSLRNRNCFIRLNHTDLLKAVLTHFKAEKWYSEVFKILIDAKENKCSRSKLETDLLVLRELGDQVVAALASHFLKEDSLQKIMSEFLKLIGKREEALSLAKKGFQQLKAIISNAECLGLNIPIKIATGMVYNIEHCSGVMFDLVCQTKQKKKKDGIDVLASGCRYDNLLQKFRKLFEITGRFAKDVSQSAVGMIISLDKIASVLKEDNTLSENVIICSLGQNVMVKEKAELVKSLWASEVKCSIEENIDTLDDLRTFGEENKVTHIITLKSNDQGTVCVMSWDVDKERYQERKFGFQEVADYIVRYSKTTNDFADVSVQRLDSKTSTNESFSGSQKFNINIISEDKMSGNLRKKYELQIKSRMCPKLENFSSRPNIEIVGVFIDSAIMKLLAANFELDEDSKDYSKNVQSIIEKNPKKKYLQKVCDKIKSFFTEKSNVIVILYSIHDEKYTFIFDRKNYKNH